jgi:D-sedoheptulose 7-phosphate isomerase
MWSDGVESFAMGKADAMLLGRVTAHFAESAQLKLAASQSLAEPVVRAGVVLAESLRGGGKVLACGNGGSAADAQHFAAELVNRFEMERPPLAAVALTTDTRPRPPLPTIIRTCRRFRSCALAGGDALLAISPAAIGERGRGDAGGARTRGARFSTGNGGGKMAPLIGADDVHLRAAQSTARIRAVHLLVLHCLCARHRLPCSGKP